VDEPLRRPFSVLATAQGLPSLCYKCLRSGELIRSWPAFFPPVVLFAFFSPFCLAPVCPCMGFLNTFLFTRLGALVFIYKRFFLPFFALPLHPSFFFPPSPFNFLRDFSSLRFGSGLFSASTFPAFIPGSVLSLFFCPTLCPHFRISGCSKGVPSLPISSILPVFFLSGACPCPCSACVFPLYASAEPLFCAFLLSFVFFPSARPSSFAGIWMRPFTSFCRGSNLSSVRFSPAIGEVSPFLPGLKGMASLSILGVFSDISQHLCSPWWLIPPGQLFQPLFPILCSLF